MTVRHRRKEINMTPNVEEFFYLQNQIIELRNKVNQIESDIMEIIDRKLGHENKQINEPLLKETETPVKKQDTLNDCILDIARCHTLLK